MAFKQVSYTYLHLLTCPYAAFLKYEGRISGPMTHYLALGNAVHLALEKMYLPEGQVEPLQTSLKLFLSEFKRIIAEDEVFVTYPQLKKAEKEGAEMVERYYAQLEAGDVPQEPLAVEQAFRLPIAGIDIVGKIDRVDRTPDGLTIVDYKTGAKKPDEWFLRRNLQFTAYYWAAKELYGEYPTRIIWHHLRNGQQLETERTEWDVEQLKRIVEGAVLQQQQDIRYRVYHEKVCDWCPYSGFGRECDDPNLEQEILSKRQLVVLNG